MVDTINLTVDWWHPSQTNVICLQYTESHTVKVNTKEHRYLSVKIQAEKIFMVILFIFNSGKNKGIFQGVNRRQADKHTK